MMETIKNLSNEADAIIIGGGQSALATAYFLKRENIKFIILDSNNEPGGAWTRTWNSLKLFHLKSILRCLGG